MSARHHAAHLIAEGRRQALAEEAAAAASVKVSPAQAAGLEAAVQASSPSCTACIPAGWPLWPRAVLDSEAGTLSTAADGIWGPFHFDCTIFRCMCSMSPTIATDVFPPDLQLHLQDNGAQPPHPKAVETCVGTAADSPLPSAEQLLQEQLESSSLPEPASAAAAAAAHVSGQPSDQANVSLQQPEQPERPRQRIQPQHEPPVPSALPAGSGPAQAGSRQLPRDQLPASTGSQGAVILPISLHEPMDHSGLDQAPEADLQPPAASPSLVPGLASQESPVQPRLLSLPARTPAPAVQGLADPLNGAAVAAPGSQGGTWLRFAAPAPTQVSLTR